jgi:hypothetical protein
VKVLQSSSGLRLVGEESWWLPWQLALTTPPPQISLGALEMESLDNILSALATGLSEPFPLLSGDSKPESMEDSDPLELRPRGASGSSIGEV